MTLILSLLKSYWLEIAVFVGAVAIGFGMAWNLQGLKLDVLEIEFAQYRNDVEQNAVAAKRAAMEQENRWRMEIENARINAQAREMRLKKEFAAAQSAVGGLRNDLATLRARLATSPEDACINTAAALGELLAQCSEDYRAMAEAADGHASDVQTLTEAWPK
jgi:hypothetical protein